jgi:hypothetical protein
LQAFFSSRKITSFKRYVTQVATFGGGASKRAFPAARLGTRGKITSFKRYVAKLFVMDKLLAEAT